MLGKNDTDKKTLFLCDQASEPMSPWDVLQFPVATWFIYGVCVTFYVAVFTFVTVGRYIVCVSVCMIIIAY